MITVNSFITMIRIKICKEIGKKKKYKNIVKADWARTDYWKPMIIVLILLHNFFFLRINYSGNINILYNGSMIKKNVLVPYSIIQLHVYKY